MIFPNKALKIINSPIPKTIIQSRDGGRGVKLDYIAGHNVIDYLNACFDYLWDYEILKVWKEECEPRTTKNNPRPVPQKPVVYAHIRLTVYIATESQGFITLKKDGIGSKEIVGGQSEQADAYKAATTDGLKKAATNFGIGLDLYRNKNSKNFHNGLKNFSINKEQEETNEIMDLLSKNDNSDIWNKTNKKKYAKELKYIQAIIKNKINSVDELNEKLSDFTDGEIKDVNKVLPSQIKDFIEYLRK